MNGTAHTCKDVKQYIRSLGYELISELTDNEYIKTKQKIVLKDKDGYYYVSIINRLENESIPLLAHKSNPYSIQNIKLWCKINNKPFDLVDGQEYIKSENNLKWKCLKDGCKEIFEATWICISAGRGCPFCNGRQVGLSNCLATKNLEMASQWHQTLNKDFTPYDITCNSMKRVWWLCKDCGHEWFVSPNARSRNNSGCPQCKASKGEKQLDLILTKYNTPHYSQYTFNDLLGIGGGILKFDVPVFWDEEKTKLRMLIEYDGEQHFKWIKGMMTKKQFESLQINDERKNNYCKNNNIKLLRIPYWDFDNIENILSNEVA